MHCYTHPVEPPQKNTTLFYPRHSRIPGTRGGQAIRQGILSKKRLLQAVIRERAASSVLDNLEDSGNRESRRYALYPFACSGRIISDVKSTKRSRRTEKSVKEQIAADIASEVFTVL